ncbi:hypothetical protein [Rossellomorea aquimaris]|nr:hypothetical protein [Rossellomorea aquimaris]
MNFIKVLVGNKKSNSQDCCQIEIKEVKDESCCSADEIAETPCC